MSGRSMLPSFVLLFLVLITLSPVSGINKTAVDEVAEGFVKLALEFGRYQPDYVDSYFGPPEWKPAPVGDSLAAFPYEELRGRANELLGALAEIDPSGPSASQQARRHFLEKHLESLGAMIDIRNGRKMTFDEESRALYDAVMPSQDSFHYDSVVQNLDRLLPGTGDIPARLADFRQQFMAPHDKLDTLIKVAIGACRARTREHISLPAGESFVVEYVDRRPWGGYNWFQGNSVSLIQIDTTRDISIGTIIGIAAHEGYPGHHVLNTLVESALYHDSGWVEFCILPLQCPFSLIAEGAGSYAVDLVFPKREKAEFLKTVLFPLAGLDTSKVEAYLTVNEAAVALSAASVDAARAYLDGKRSREETVTWLVRHGGLGAQEAERSLDFDDQYRSYVINYALGQELVRRYAEYNEKSENTERRWERFTSLMTTPMTASNLEDWAN